VQVRPTRPQVLHLVIQRVNVLGERRRGPLRGRCAAVRALVEPPLRTLRLRLLALLLPPRVVLLRGRRSLLPLGLRSLRRAGGWLGLRSRGARLLVLVRGVVGLGGGRGAVRRRRRVQAREPHFPPRLDPATKRRGGAAAPSGGKHDADLRS
jgi:hypothetical protein